MISVMSEGKQDPSTELQHDAEELTAQEQKPASRWIAPIILSALTGILFAACFPGFINKGSLVWIAPIPFFVALWRLQTRRGRKGLFLGLIAGLTFWCINLKWLLAMGELNFVPQAGAALGLLALSSYLSLYFAAYGFIVGKWFSPWRNMPKTERKDTNPGKSGIQSRLDEKIAAKSGAKKKKLRNAGLRQSLRTLRFAAIHASLWTTLEWIRSWMLTGFGWNGAGAAFHDTPVMAQAAELVGVTGLAFVPIFVASIFAQVAVRLYQETRSGRFRPHWDVGVAALTIVACFQFGVTRLRTLAKADTMEVNTLLIQRNISQNIKWSEKSNEIQKGYVDSTVTALQEIEAKNEEAFESAIKEGKEGFTIDTPDLVVWPESALTTPLGWSTAENKHVVFQQTGWALRDVLSDTSATLVLGLNEVTVERDKLGSYLMWQEDFKMYNSIVTVGKRPTATEDQPDYAIQSYRKHHLVMFGEYIPLREELPVLSKLVASSGGAMGPNFSQGESLDPLTLRTNGKEFQIIPSVCFEDTVAHLCRKFIRKEPQLMLNATNDGWFGESEGAAQQVANSKFRCIENRRPMVRAANTGVTCIIDVRGSLYDHKSGLKNIVADEKGNQFIEGHHYGKAYILTKPPMTLYTLAGNWFIGVCAALFVFCAALPLVRKP